MAINIFRKKKIIVTGGAGFIGSWLACALADLGAKVIILDLKKSNPVLADAPRTSGLILIKGDVRNFGLVKRVVLGQKPDLIFHLAAQTIVGEAVQNPVLTLSTNIIGTWNILEVARLHHRPKAIIVASSDKAYGDQPIIPYKENTPLMGLYPYDASKSSADLISQMYFKTYGLPICVARSANVFGGGDTHFSRIVPDTIRSLLNNKRPVIRSDGKLKRDYLYVKDAAQGYLTLAQAALEKKTILGQVFNFGTNSPYSVNKVVSVISDLMGKKGLGPIILNQAKNEIQNQSLDFSKARKLLGWKSRYSLKSGLKETIQWYTRYFREKKY